LLVFYNTQIVVVFVYIQVKHGGQFYWWKKLVYPEKTIDLLLVTENFIT